MKFIINSSINEVIAQVPRHCEERSDEAIQRPFLASHKATGLLRYARNDGVYARNDGVYARNDGLTLAMTAQESELLLSE